MMWPRSADEHVSNEQSTNILGRHISNRTKTFLGHVHTGFVQSACLLFLIVIYGSEAWGALLCQGNVSRILCEAYFEVEHMLSFTQSVEEVLCDCLLDFMGWTHTFHQGTRKMEKLILSV